MDTHTKSDSSDVILVREKLLVLGLINATQPIDEHSIKKELEKKLGRPRIALVLKILRKDQLIVDSKDGKIRVTYKGRSAFGSKSLRQAADISRMLYLIATTKGGKAESK